MVSENDFTAIELLMMKICNKRIQFERLDLTKEQAVDMFSYNKYKVEFIT